MKAAIIKALCCLPAILDQGSGYSQDPLKWGDMVINEIMVDPEPCAAECMGEYVELINRSDHAVALDSFWLQVGSRKYRPGDHWPAPGDSLESGDFFVISNVQVANGGGTIILWSAGGKIIHSVDYGLPRHSISWKEEGGWSLEAVDPNLICGISGQWRWSEDPAGGTPGRENSVLATLEDHEDPVLLYHGIGEESMFLYFSEMMGEPGSILSGCHLEAAGVYSSLTQISAPRGQCLIFGFPGSLPARPGFPVKLPPLSDCEGNLLPAKVFTSGIPSKPLPGDLVINEIMFDPEDGHPQFIELYHCGAGYTDISQLKLGVSRPDESPDHLLPLSDHSHLFGKNEFLVLCRDSNALMDAYDLELSGSWLEMKDLPSMNTSAGCIALFDQSGNTLDRFCYESDMHMEGMDLKRGVSLERIRPEAPAEDPGNWHSAASIEGYSTPGRENSQHAEMDKGSQLLQVRPAVFSPGFDGYRDIQEILISGLDTGSVLRLWITDLNGFLIRTLANNHIAGPDLCYCWDGRDGEGRLVKPGFYVIHMEAFHIPGGKRWKRRVASGVVHP